MYYVRKRSFTRAHASALRALCTAVCSRAQRSPSIPQRLPCAASRLPRAGGCSTCSATRNTQHATRNTQHATRNTQHATRNTQHAECCLQHATCCAVCAALVEGHSSSSCPVPGATWGCVPKGSIPKSALASVPRIQSEWCNSVHYFYATKTKRFCSVFAI